MSGGSPPIRRMTRPSRIEVGSGALGGAASSGTEDGLARPRVRGGLVAPPDCADRGDAKGGWKVIPSARPATVQASASRKVGGETTAGQRVGTTPGPLARNPAG